MKLRVIMVAVLAGATAMLGVGCTGTPPSNDVEAQQQAQWLGNGIFMILYMALCQANYGNCPFPLGPSDPLVVAAPTNG